MGEFSRFQLSSCAQDISVTETVMTELNPLLLLPIQGYFVDYVANAQLLGNFLSDEVKLMVRLFPSMQTEPAGGGEPFEAQ